ncbi:hypothetical protein BDV25DRAFT_132165 [Aspergillus avenaceus]|uniref:NmrA-like domain-containing protein n=1 Tax=Aspergillus avenaceus TaxID=36643 RepID=A0A5N6TLW3_ASPAV|nr:hypothetical protein BDV25DRAFT_132165 [Aspergillus avenaceus]
MSTATYFVCGATGTQGGAVVNNLLKHGAKVHAMTRNVDSPAARSLQARGVVLAKGDFASADDEDTLRQSMQGCSGVFINLMPSFTDSTSERTQAQRILTVAHEANVQHVIYSSGFTVNEPERLSTWDPTNLVAQFILSKQAIEISVRAAQFKNWTILRPGNFMANYLDPLVRMYPGLVETGVFTTALRPDTQLPMVDHNDIGAFAAAAFLNPTRFNKQEIEIASEFLTVDQVMQALSRATGKQFSAVYMSDEEVEAQKAQNPFIEGQILSRDMAQFVDLDQVRAWGVPLGSFEEFLVREKDSVKSTYSV